MTDQTIAPDQTTAVVLLYDAFARRDMVAGVACMASDIEWREADWLPWGGLQVGPAAVAEGVFAPALERVPDLAVTPEDILASDDTVIVVHRYTGTVAATGAELDLLGVGAWNVRDGRIARYRQFVDTAMLRPAIAA
jgi:uncharacterized protein